MRVDYGFLKPQSTRTYIYCSFFLGSWISTGCVPLSLPPPTILLNYSGVVFDLSTTSQPTPLPHISRTYHNI